MSLESLETNNMENIDEPKKKRSVFEFIKDEFIIPCIIGSLFGIAFNFFIGFTFVSGSSMNPTLTDRDYLMLNKIGKSSAENGDIIVFDTTPEAPRKEKIYYIKRVIATEGDLIQIENGVVRVNGIPLEENYTDGSVTEGIINAVVPKDKYFVLGDNRDGSTDSRIFGFVDKSDIVGIVINRIYPFKAIGK